MVRRQQIVYLFLTLVIAAAVSAGCSTTRKMVGKIMPGGSDLKKRVMVTTPLDLASLGEQRVSEIKQTFMGMLQNSPDVLVFSYESHIEAALANRPPFGPGAPRAIVEAADDARMNAVLTWSLAPIETEVRKSGIWPFRDTERFYATTIIVNVIDVAQGAIVATKTDSCEYSVPVDEAEIGEVEAVDAALRNEVWNANLPDLLEELVENVLETLEETPWRGRLVPGEGGGLQIPAGRDVGIGTGQVFTVFSPGGEVVANGGKTYDLMGKEVGEIEVTSVADDTSRFKTLSDMNLKPGMLIEYKP